MTTISYWLFLLNSASAFCQKPHPNFLFLFRSAHKIALISWISLEFLSVLHRVFLQYKEMKIKEITIRYSRQNSSKFYVRSFQIIFFFRTNNFLRIKNWYQKSWVLACGTSLLCDNRRRFSSDKSYIQKKIVLHSVNFYISLAMMVGHFHLKRNAKFFIM